MNEPTKKIRAKGYLAKEVAERWGIPLPTLHRLQKRRPQLYADAVAGLPEKEEK